MELRTLQTIVLIETIGISDKGGLSLELTHLKTFYTISQTQSFTQAAELLDYAQSSVSAQVKMLEDNLDVKLFERIGRKVYLTDAGEKLLFYAERILKLADEAQECVSASVIPKGKLVIGAPESICIYRLPIVLQEYRRLFPEVELVLRLGPCADLFSWLRQNEIDIAVLMDKDITAKDLVAETLRPEEMVLVSVANHPLTQKDLVTPIDLQGEQIIMIEKDACYRCIFQAQLEADNVQPASTMEIGSIETVKKCVASGLGISLLPLMTVEGELSTGVISSLTWGGQDFSIESMMIHHKDKWLSPALMAFMDLSRKLLVHEKNQQVG